MQYGTMFKYTGISKVVQNVDLSIYRKLSDKGWKYPELAKNERPEMESSELSHTPKTTMNKSTQAVQNIDTAVLSRTDLFTLLGKKIHFF